MEQISRRCCRMTLLYFNKQSRVCWETKFSMFLCGLHIRIMLNSSHDSWKKRLCTVIQTGETENNIFFALSLCVFLLYLYLFCPFFFLFSFFLFSHFSFLFFSSCLSFFLSLFYNISIQIDHYQKEENMLLESVPSIENNFWVK